jgi:leucyl aminopeptidase
MTDVILASSRSAAPVHALYEHETAAFLEGRQAFVRAFAATSDFKGKAGQVLIVPNTEGAVDRILFGLGAEGRADAMSFRALATKLPAGDYRIAQAPPAIPADQIALAFAMGAYKFDRYRKNSDEPARLVVGAAVLEEARQQAHACALARDMINTPANDMGPLQVETIAREIAEQYGAQITVTVGEGLLEAGYPAVHAVGRAAAAHRAPRMIELTWGEADHPLVALVGKGVVFDTGGISIKPAAGMEEMTMDMGGAGVVAGVMRTLALRRAKANVVGLVGLVENMPDGRAQRPGDIVRSMKGDTIEVINTDAEGRLVLADVLWYAQTRFNPSAVIDLATLTGAVIIALGHDNAGVFANDDALADSILAAAKAEGEGAWRLPLGQPYDTLIKSRLADMKNTGGRAAGSITAAQFLQRFIRKGTPWAHIDIAGVALPPAATDLAPKGATGWGVMTLDRLVRDGYEAK